MKKNSYLIYEFTTQNEAQACLGAVHSMARDYWDERGYIVNDEGVVGKKNGKDNINAQETIKWDDVKTSPDGTFYFTSLSTSPNYPNGTKMLIDAGFNLNERTFPDAWRRNIE